MHPARPGWLQACSRAPLASSGSGVGGLFSLALPPSLGSQAVPPTSAALWALGGSLFRGHKAPLILCSAPSHVTRWAGRALRRPAQPVAAAGVSPPLPLFLAASHRRRGASGGAAAPGLPEGTATGPRAASPRAPRPRPADRSASPGEGRWELGLHAGPRFSAAEQKKGALCGHSYLFVNIWPARLSG